MIIRILKWLTRAKYYVSYWDCLPLKICIQIMILSRQSCRISCQIFMKIKISHFFIKFYISILIKDLEKMFSMAVVKLMVMKQWTHKEYTF